MEKEMLSLDSSSQLNLNNEKLEFYNELQHSVV